MYFMNQSTYLQKLNWNGKLRPQQFWKITYLKLILHLQSYKAVQKYATGSHRCSKGTYEPGERSRPTEFLTGAMFSGVLAVFFSNFWVF